MPSRQEIKSFTPPENPEEANALALWISAIFETRGTLGFKFSEWPNKPIRVSPKMSVSDNNPEFPRIKDILQGGTVISRKEDDSLMWQTSGSFAASLIPFIGATMPSRRQAIQLFQILESMTDINERLTFATQHKYRIGERAPVNVEDYFFMIQDPDFLAGILDIATTFHNSTTVDKRRTTGYTYTQPILSLHTPNVSILEAFYNLYRGHWGSEYYKGKEHKSLHLSRRDIEPVLEKVKDSLRLRSFELDKR